MSDERVTVGRRAFFVFGASAILGGCVQGGTPGGGGAGQASRTETTTNRPETDSVTTVRGDVGIGIDSDKSEPQTTETIGGTSGRDEVDDEDTIFVWNDADTARRITVAVEEKEASGSPLFRETYRFEPDAYVTLDVPNPGEYEVTTGVDGKEPTTVEFKTDDCNDQSRYITVVADGTVESNGISTSMLCTTLAVTSTNDG